MTSVVETRSTELAIGGMTCAACAARVERKLNKLDGVNAQADFGTERASVENINGIHVEQLVAQIEAAAYTAMPLRRDTPGPGDHESAEQVRRLWRRLVLALLLGAPTRTCRSPWHWFPRRAFPADHGSCWRSR
jgi:P-type Cu+ transporter